MANTILVGFVETPRKLIIAKLSIRKLGSLKELIMRACSKFQKILLESKLFKTSRKRPYFNKNQLSSRIIYACT